MDFGGFFCCFLFFSPAGSLWLLQIPNKQKRNNQCHSWVTHQQPFFYFSYPTLRSLQGDVHIRLSWDIRTEEWETLRLTPERTPKQAVCVPLGAPETPTNYVWYFIYMSIWKLNSCQQPKTFFECFLGYIVSAWVTNCSTRRPGNSHQYLAVSPHSTL